MDRRTLLLSGIDPTAMVGAEVGPQSRALIAKHEGRVVYVDHCDTEELRRRFATEPAVDISKLHVDAVWGECTLHDAIGLALGAEAGGISEVALDYVLASHVIEHVPDFVTWLDEVQAVLKKDDKTPGRLRLAVPDKRYCFDYLRAPTIISDVLEAYALRRRRPSARCIIDWSLHMTKIDTVQAWLGTIVGVDLVRLNTLEGSLAIARDAEFNGVYHDVHCWVFTPHSFISVCTELACYGLLHLACEWVVPTRRNEFEFFVSLRPSSSSEDVIESWRNAMKSLPESA